MKVKSLTLSLQGRLKVKRSEENQIHGEHQRLSREDPEFAVPPFLVPHLGEVPPTNNS